MNGYKPTVSLLAITLTAPAYAGNTRVSLIQETIRSVAGVLNREGFPSAFVGWWLTRYLELLVLVLECL